MNIKKLFNLSLLLILGFILSGCANSQFAKKYNKNVTRVSAKKVFGKNYPLKQSMNTSLYNKYIRKIK